MRIGDWPWPAPIGPPRAAAAKPAASMIRASVFTGTVNVPYERDLGPWRRLLGIRMNDISRSPDATPAIALDGVNLALGRGAARVHILKDIDLDIGAGEAIGLVGPSGSGKSTLL